MNQRTSTFLLVSAAILLTAIGWSTGRKLAKSANVFTETPMVETPALPEKIKVTHSFREALQLQDATDSLADSYRLALEIGAMPIAELADNFIRLANEKRLGDKEFQAVKQALIDRDPQAAIRLFDEHLPDGGKSYAYSLLIKRWGRADPQATLNFLATFDGENDSHAAYSAVTKFMYEWASRDPESALAARQILLSKNLTDSNISTYAMRGLARSAAMLPETREEALAIMFQEPESKSRTQMIAGALAKWVKQTVLTTAANWIESQELSGKERSKIAVTVATAAALGDDSTAGAWLEKTISGSPKERSKSLDEFATNWARDHPNRCAEWLATLEPSPENDGAIRGFLRSVENKDPESGLHWTRNISDPELRKKSASRQWNAWRRKAPVSAEAFIPNLGDDERLWFHQKSP